MIAATRAPGTSPATVDADFTRDLYPSSWAPKLRGVDIVINAVGILREQGAQTFERVHVLAPQALFAACAAVGVRRVVQISALGAVGGTSGYFRSKRQADEFLARLPLDWTIVQPSLVFGIGGASARLFTMLAELADHSAAGRRETTGPAHPYRRRRACDHGHSAASGLRPPAGRTGRTRSIGAARVPGSAAARAECFSAPATFRFRCL